MPPTAGISWRRNYGRPGSGGRLAKVNCPSPAVARSSSASSSPAVPRCGTLVGLLDPWGYQPRPVVLKLPVQRGFPILRRHIRPGRGAPELPDPLYPVLRDQSNFHAAHLARFRDEIKTGDQLLDGTASSRSSLYADASWAVAHNVERAGKWLDGEAECHDSSAGSSESPTIAMIAWGLAALAWQPIGTLPAIGGVECMSRCHCTFIYA
jgi:hypothetical protein